MEDSEAPWREFLRFRYGSFSANFLLDAGREGLIKASIWWRDIWSLGCGAEGGWFGSLVSSTLGDGIDIAFWKEKWMGTSSLRNLFPALFAKSMLPDGNIAQMGTWEGEAWSWDLTWHSTLLQTEVEEAEYLMTLLQPIVPNKDKRDRRRWLESKDGVFTVHSAYLALSKHQYKPLDNPSLEATFKKLWLNNVPSKVSIFGWRLLLEKLPTKEALFKKGIITNNFERSCVFCVNEVEDIHHVLFNCNVSRQVWSRIFRGWVFSP
jgi:hypothetical protein